jgi:hypothetical protein
LRTAISDEAAQHLGPNCVDASVNVTMVIENTIPTTVMTDAAIEVSIWRAARRLR